MKIFASLSALLVGCHFVCAQTNASIPWDQLGAQAGAAYKCEGLSVIATESGARLHCVFQRLEGEVTREGLSLSSSLTNQAGGRFSVKAVGLGRDGGAHGVTRPTMLQTTGDVSVDGQTVRFSRPGLVEEYSVSVDGVRQDFVVLERPSAARHAELRVELAVIGARVEPAAYGAKLVLQQGERKVAYSRLKVTDANGKELPARMEVCRKSEIQNPKSKMRLAVVVDDADAVYPVRIDPTFSDANWISLGGLNGAGAAVYASVADGLGNVYIGGGFTVIGDVVANYIARWDGSAWRALGSGMNSPVRALAVSGTDVYAGGEFTTAGGNAATNIAKWNGSTWSAVGTGMNGVVYALAVSGINVYAGGNFTSAGGSAATNINV